MSAAALDRLIACEEVFIAGLDGDDVAALERSIVMLEAALSPIAAAGGWHDDGELGARLIQALRLSEAARGRINYLADRNRRKLDKLAQLTGAPRAHAYGRHGRFG